MPLNPNDEVTIKLTVSDLNQFITAINAYYTGLISKVVQQANSQTEAERAGPPVFTNGPLESDSEEQGQGLRK
jgi:hypothetical protein